MDRWDILYTHANLATLAPGATGYGVVRDGALAIRGDRIDWLGAHSELSSDDRERADRVVDLDGRWITPGLVDCHTHTVFGGDRADEFAARLRGESYEEIARRGGGIRSTVRATREASAEALLRSALGRIDRMIAEGVTTVEIKSGYGLDLETEVEMLRIAHDIENEGRIRTLGTYLGLHALPPEFEEDRGRYVDEVVEEMLPAVVDSGFARQADAFLEGIAFTAEECGRFLMTARDLGLRPRLHADQLSDGNGAEWATRWGATSADHLEFTSERGVEAMAEAGTVAVLLPGAFHTLRETHAPPIERFRRAGVPMAVATDLNPGTSPLNSILTAMNLACTLFRLTPVEALAGVTRNAAKALAMEGEIGELAVGMRADLAIWSIESPDELPYWIGANPLFGRVFGGRPD